MEKIQTLVREEPSLAFWCPRCHFDAPEPEEQRSPTDDPSHNPSTDRWFTCPSCGYKWSVSPLSDS